MEKSMMEKSRFLPVITLSTTLFLTACSAHDLPQGEAAGLTRSSSQGSVAAHKKISHPATGDPAAKLSGNPVVLDLTNRQGLNSIIPRLMEDRVVYVGETHDQFGHHLNQLEVIRQLHHRNPAMAIGMEFFQQPFQSVLDDYIGGRISEKEMLLKTEWYDRWRYDYRLYRPIMRYAREHRIPVIALNVARELTDRVSEVGVAGLNEAERIRVPQELDNSNERYRERIRAVYQAHPHAGSGGFDRFLEVQLTWDEGMAEQVVRYLQKNGDKNMVVLAGSGHLMYGTGIPSRVQRRLPVKSHIILPAENMTLNPDIADFIIYPDQIELPPAGLMGVLLDQGERGVRVSGLVPKSAAKQAGVEEGDFILYLNGEAVSSTADIKIGMLDKSPGDRVKLQILRESMVWGEKILQFDFNLVGE